MKYLMLTTKRFLFLVLPACLMVAGAAQACQLVCLKTNTRYNGNLGGYAGADAKCAAEFTGFKFPRSADMVGAYVRMQQNSAIRPWGFGAYYQNAAYPVGAGGPYYPAHYAWIGSQPWYTGTLYNCSTWGSSSNAGYGGTMAGTNLTNTGGSASNAPLSYSMAAPCDTMLPLICCNM